MDRVETRDLNAGEEVFQDALAALVPRVAAQLDKLLWEQVLVVNRVWYFMPSGLPKLRFQ